MLTDLAIRRPVFTAMLAVSLVVLGGVSFFRLGTDLFPDVSLPYVTVVTIYPGAGPQDVEEEVTGPIEDAVAGVSGAEQIFSRSGENFSMVWLQFSMETPIDTAVQEVRERVEGVVRDLPEGAERPRVSRFDVRAFPILSYSIAAGQDPERTRELAEDTIKPALEQIPGVALVRVEGGRRREIQVRLDPERLDAHGLAAGQVFQRLQAENIDLPAGRFERGPTEFGVRVDATVATAEEVANLIISGGNEEQLRELGRTVAALARGGQTAVASLPESDRTPLRVRDVGEVAETAVEERTVVRLNGSEAVILEVVKQAGANTVEIADAVKAVMARLQRELPDDVRITRIRDDGEPIQANAHDVERGLVLGGLMAVLVILVFLVDWRGTVISALALPVSVIGTFGIMYALGFTLNILTLMGLALAIGLLIDDSVVVRESITRRIELGDDPFTAAREGTKEIRLAVLATTLTVCAVFIPVAFMSGLVGQFFKEFGLTVAGAVLLSLLVAFTLDPMLSARMVRQRQGEAADRPGVARSLRRGWAALDRAYLWCLRGVLRHPVLTVAAGVASFVGAAALVPVLGLEFIPQQDRGRFILYVHFPAGVGLSETSRRSLTFEREALAVEDVTGVQCVVGDNNDPRRVRCNILCRPKTERTRTLQDIKEDVRQVAARLAQASVSIMDVSVLEGTGDYPPIQMQIRGPDLDVLYRHAERIAEELRAVPGTSDVRIDHSAGLPELAVQIDRDRARDRGLSAADLALQTRLALHGEVAGRARAGRRNIDIRVMLAESFRRNPDALGELLVFGNRGPVPLGDVAEIQPRSGPVTISHQGRQRQISVNAQVVGRPLGDVVRDLRARFDPIDWGEGYGVIYRGLQEEMGDANAGMGLALLLGLVFIYLILASQFESLMHPLTIVLSLPFGFVGAFLALLLRDCPLSLAASLGIILLVGLCAKNGILLVDGALQRMRDDSLGPREAMEAAGPRRLRPILMTSAAMVFGMLPTALAQETGSEFRFPMAVAVIGGVISNTVLTLLILPVMFVLLERLARLLRRLAGWGTPPAA